MKTATKSGLEGFAAAACGSEGGNSPCQVV